MPVPRHSRQHNIGKVDIRYTLEKDFCTGVQLPRNLHHIVKYVNLRH